MEQKILVSVIMPCYNGEEFLKEALDSFANNKRDDFELIIVDDGSIDDSPNIIVNFKQNNECNIRYYRIDNHGVSYARNYGLSKASGDYILFLDCDDCYSSSFIESMLDFSITSNSDLVFCYWNNNNKKNINTKSRSVKKKAFASIMLYHNKNVHLCSILYRKSIIDTYEIRFREDLKYGEDLDFVWKYLVHCDTFFFNSKCFYYHRDNTKSAVHKFSLSKIDTIELANDNFSMIETYYPCFLKRVEKYAVQRNVLAVQKELARNNKKDMFDFIRTKYSKLSYSNLLFHDSLANRIASLLYIVSPSLFFFILRKIWGTK